MITGLNLNLSPSCLSYTRLRWKQWSWKNSPLPNCAISAARTLSCMKLIQTFIIKYKSEMLKNHPKEVKQIIHIYGTEDSRVPFSSLEDISSSYLERIEKISHYHNISNEGRGCNDLEIGRGQRPQERGTRPGVLWQMPWEECLEDKPFLLQRPLLPQSNW